MKVKNDCQVDHIKEAFDKLYNCVMPFVDLTQFDDAAEAFKELDKKIHSEIYILKKCLAERDRAVEAGLTRSKVDRERISDLESENNAKQHVIESFVAKVNDLEKKLNIERKHGEDLADVNGQLASENVDLKARLTLFEHSRIIWRDRAQHAEKEVTDLNKKVSDLEKELAEERERTWARLEECDISTREQASYKSLVEAIEFQGKRIEELEAEKTRLKEAYDIQETTIKRLKLLLGKEYKKNVDLSYGHKFEFGDEVFVPWSCDPYMYIKSGQLYNPRTERLVYVDKDQHLKWFGEKFAIV